MEELSKTEKKKVLIDMDTSVAIAVWLGRRLHGGRREYRRDKW